MPEHERKRNKKHGAGKGDDDDSAALGEYATLMEGEYHEFVVFEIEQVEAAKDE